MSPSEFLRRQWVADGAMATYLFTKGAPQERPVEGLNLTNPALVAEVHREYLDAGAQILRTNTFTAHEGNAEGVRIARQVASGRALVAGVIGSRTDGDHAHFRNHAESLGEVDLVILETFRDLAELRAAVSAAREVHRGVVIVAQVSPDADGGFPAGLPQVGADLIGFNCGFGAESVRLACERVYGGVFSAFPSAGLETMLPPAELAEYARRYFEGGACVVGACCGSTPEHIRAIAREHATLVSQWPRT